MRPATKRSPLPTLSGVLILFGAVLSALIFLPAVCPYDQPMVITKWIDKDAAESITSSNLAWLKPYVETSKGDRCNISITVLGGRNDLVRWLFRSKNLAIVQVTFTPEYDLANPAVTLTLLDEQNRVRGYSLCVLPFLYGVRGVDRMTSCAVSFLMEIPQEQARVTVVATVYELNTDGFRNYHITTDYQEPFVFRPQYCEKWFFDSVEVNTKELTINTFAILVSTVLTFGGTAWSQTSQASKKRNAWLGWVVMIAGLFAYFISWQLL